MYPESVCDNRTYFDSFDFQGEKYNLNTFVELKENVWRNEKTKYLTMIQIVENGLTQYGNPFCTCAFWDSYGDVTHMLYVHSPEDIIERISLPSNSSPVKPEQEYYKDIEVSGVLSGWVLYLAIMFFGMIFRGFIVLWVFGSTASMRLQSSCAL